MQIWTHYNLSFWILIPICLLFWSHEPAKLRYRGQQCEAPQQLAHHESLQGKPPSYPLHACQVPILLINDKNLGRCTADWVEADTCSRNLASSSAGNGTGDGGRTSLQIKSKLESTPDLIRLGKSRLKNHNTKSLSETGLVVLVRREWAILREAALINTETFKFWKQGPSLMVTFHDTDY